MSRPISPISNKSPTAASVTSLENVAADDSPSNLFIAAQKGELQTLHDLLKSGQADANDRDAQNITALHWAAINNRLVACKDLLGFGAEVVSPESPSDILVWLTFVDWYRTQLVEN